MTVSLIGDGIFLVAQAWQVYDLDNDPVALSLVGTAWTVGMVAFLLTGGIVSDRAERRRGLIAADPLRAPAPGAVGGLSPPRAIALLHPLALAGRLRAGGGVLRPP